MQEYINAVLESVLTNSIAEMQKRITWTQSTDKDYNPFYIVGKKRLRVRVETLVFNDNNQILVVKRNKPNKYGNYYTLPGGGIDKDRTFAQQARKECQEEALINIEDIQYTGQSYIRYYDKTPEWMDRVKIGPCHGSISFVFIAKYKNKFKGHIRDIDKDEFADKCEWANIQDIKFMPEHKEAIKLYLKLK